ncbi:MULTISPECIES: hypothetical protein [unclassified Lentimonas]|uniref:hypothetical protein n=1 Tax=unclassified Lentimonas TaxID=2630993 RepID=UPI0013261781|nr:MULTISPECIES: hypothetical protein [unclassified Lentimonas]CAA6689437.1 Unannotated [Lentimonas sp. CC10]CAA6696410.1 Unannotated [Lentimonas sp. CC19]CAA7070502.1 Unannotated [Lentimonas sp. CC11]
MALIEAYNVCFVDHVGSSFGRFDVFLQQYYRGYLPSTAVAFGIRWGWGRCAFEIGAETLGGKGAAFGDAGHAPVGFAE